MPCNSHAVGLQFPDPTPAPCTLRCGLQEDIVAVLAGADREANGKETGSLKKSDARLALEAFLKVLLCLLRLWGEGRTGVRAWATAAADVPRPGTGNADLRIRWFSWDC